MRIDSIHRRVFSCPLSFPGLLSLPCMCSYFTINLTYRDDVTPENYEPHYFEERKDKSKYIDHVYVQ